LDCWADDEGGYAREQFLFEERSGLNSRAEERTPVELALEVQTMPGIKEESTFIDGRVAKHKISSYHD